jgi:hypothetical protein
MIRSLIAILTFYFSTAVVIAAPININQVDFMPPEGVVPNEKVAISIAKSVLSSFYGEATIDRQQPLKATLLDENKWLVSGTSNSSAGKKGGVAYIVIMKSDGRVIGMISEK